MRSEASSAFPDAGLSGPWVKLQPSVARLFRASSTLRHKVLFDLGFYEPTALAREVTGAHLRPGDINFPDEAVLPVDRHVLDEMILPSTGCEPVGATPIVLGLAVTRPVR